MNYEEFNQLGAEKALRYNKKKARFDLLPPEAIYALAEHYGKGAEKYAPRNWERGTDWNVPYASLMRHVIAWQSGEDHDPENGTHHMISAAWNALAIYTYYMREIGTDDRPMAEPIASVLHESSDGASRSQKSSAKEPSSQE